MSTTTPHVEGPYHGIIPQYGSWHVLAQTEVASGYIQGRKLATVSGRLALCRSPENLTWAMPPFSSRENTNHVGRPMARFASPHPTSSKLDRMAEHLVASIRDRPPPPPLRS